MSSEIHECYNELLESFEFIKEYVRRSDRHLFERWKAGGFLVDTSIVSQYPNIEEVMESLGTDDYEDEDEEEFYVQDDEGKMYGPYSKEEAEQRAIMIDGNVI